MKAVPRISNEERCAACYIEKYAVGNYDRRSDDTNTKTKIAVKQFSTTLFIFTRCAYQQHKRLGSTGSKPFVWGIIPNLRYCHYRLLLYHQLAVKPLLADVPERYNAVV